MYYVYIYFLVGSLLISAAVEFYMPFMIVHVI